jgi:hypothetical protein
VLIFFDEIRINDKISEISMAKAALLARQPEPLGLGVNV